ncbi:MAG: Ig-like domain-containing protein, partial [Clostridia bacterium]
MVSSKLWENDLNAIVVYINIIEAASMRIGFKQSDYVIALNESIVIAPVYTPENAKSHLRYTLTRSSATSATAEAVAMTVADDEQSVTLKASNTVRGVYILKVETYSTNPNIVLPKAEGTCTITVGYRATGIAVDKPYLTMGVGEKLSPGYKLLPAGAVSSDVYYSIERILPADLWGDQVGGNAVSYLRPGTAITDDQLDPNDYTKSVSGEYTGSYIQAVSPGVIRVEMRTATSAHNTGVKTQWVIEIKDTPTSIDFPDRSDVTLLSGMTVTRRAALTPSTAYGTVTYESSNERVATVDENGKVTAKVFGNDGDSAAALIVARTYNGLSTFYKVIVYNDPGKIILNGEEDPNVVNRYTAEIGVNEQFTITPSFDQTHITPNPLSYSKLDTAYLRAVGGQNGINYTVQGVRVTKPGETKAVSVTTPNGKVADIAFTIKNRPYKITLDQTKATIGLGEHYQMRPRVYKSNNVLADDTIRQKLIYTSSNEVFATVDANGVVSVTNNADYLGKSFTITVQSVCGRPQSGSSSLSCTFTVMAEPTNVFIDQTYPIKREKISSITLVEGSTTMTKVRAGFAPDSAASDIDYFIGLNASDYTTTLVKNSPDYNPNAYLYLDTETDRDGRLVLCIKPLKQTPNPIIFQPTAYNGLRARLSVMVCGIAAESDIKPLPEVTLAAGMTYQIVPEFATPNVSANFEFLSSATSYVQVDRNTGLVTARRACPSPLTITVRWKSADNRTYINKYMSVKVVSAPTGFLFKRLDPADATIVTEDGITNMSVALTTGEECKFRYYYAPVGAMSDNVTLENLYTSEKPYVSYSITPDADGCGGIITVTGNKEHGNSPIRLALSTVVGNTTRTSYVFVYVKAQPNWVQMSTTSLQLAPGTSATLNAFSEPEGSGGSIYYQLDPSTPSGLVTLNAQTGKLTVVSDVTQVETIYVYAFSTAIPSKPIDGRNTCVVTILRAPGSRDIQDNLYYKNTENPTRDKYTDEDIANKTICVGDVLNLAVVFPENGEIPVNTKVVFSVHPEDASFLQVNAAGAITGRRDTPENRMARAYVKIYGSEGLSKALMLNFTILPRPNKITLDFKDPYDYILKKGLKLNSNDTKDLETEYGLTWTISPSSVQSYAIVGAYSSNASVVDVYQDGNTGHWTVQTKRRGTAYIYFYTANKAVKTSFKVTTYDLPTDINLRPSVLTIGVGMKQLVKAFYGPNGTYTDAAVTFVPLTSAVTVDKDVTDPTDMQVYVTGKTPTGSGYAQVAVNSLDPDVAASTMLIVKVLD